MLWMQVSSYPNHVSVRHGGSLLWYLRGLLISANGVLLMCNSLDSSFLSIACILVILCMLQWLICCSFASQIFKLYERCLVACANYPEFWIRYIFCMEASGSNDLADNALARATQVFVKVFNFIYICIVHVLLWLNWVNGSKGIFDILHLISLMFC